ncbi:hypothetical protein PYJP_00820 [Pyrofollis japonicus]|uniref:phosphate-starvation-inducible PsiE family protein n=1 Tax=Pyrofollis japonicus TaxID=3060460 RepID=UPI00295ADAB4|nr:phosphate-starvation-inducible PsiE family protein [Pyrofollis japonicus]BEP16730.1 hypothetical protein PYJP_00820 [Pyrofollis japonicus]
MSLAAPSEREKRIVEKTYHVFELIALIALATATLAAIVEFFKALIVEGFSYTEVLEKILLIFIFIDLTRTIVVSIVGGRFRMDILLEAITIALARDLIFSIASEAETFSVVRAATLGGLLSVTVVLWIMARRVEIQTIRVEEERQPMN